MHERILRWLGLEAVPDAWPAGVATADAQRALDHTLLVIVRPVSLVVAGIYLLVAVLHLCISPAPIRWILAGVAVINGLALLGTSLAARAQRLPASRVAETVFGLALLTYAQSLVHLGLNPQPGLVGVPAVIILVISLLLPKTRLLLIFDVLAVVGFAVVTQATWHQTPPLYYALLLVITLMTGLPLHLFFQTLLLRLHAHRVADRARAAELETTVSALEAVRGKYELLARNVSDVIWIRDLDLRPVYISPSVARLRGFTAPEVMTQAPDQIFSDESLDQARQWLAHELALERSGAAEPDRSRVVELQVPHQDGHLVWTEARVSFLRDDNGQPTGIVGISRDVSERHAAQQRLDQVLAELRRSNAELEQFAYVASHDLKEPLRVVASQLRLLERRCATSLDERGLRYLGHAVNGAVRMQELIDGLLAYSRYGASALRCAPVALDSVLDEVLGSLAVALQEGAVTLHRKPLPTVYGDRQKLTHLLQNLLSNAIKFRRAEGPEIQVGVATDPPTPAPRAEPGPEASPPRPPADATAPGSAPPPDATPTRSAETPPPRKDGVVIFVRDNGIGVEPAHHERIFRLFERLHTREEYEGTGIGLALCRRIVDQHGGQLWLTSTPGEGSTLYCRLPTSAPHAEPLPAEAVMAGPGAADTAQATGAAEAPDPATSTPHARCRRPPHG